MIANIVKFVFVIAAVALWSWLEIYYEPTTPIAVPQASTPRLFHVIQHPFASMAKLDVEADGRRYGTITETDLSVILHITKMTYEDATGQASFKASDRFWSGNFETDVFDAEDHQTFKILEDISLTEFSKFYVVSGADGRKIAQSIPTARCVT